MNILRTGGIILLNVTVVHINRIQVSKYTNTDGNCVYRTRQNREPEVYLIAAAYYIDWTCEACSAGEWKCVRRS